MNNKDIAEDAFRALREAHSEGLVEFEKANLFDDIFLHFDAPAQGVHRFTYVMFDANNNILAQVIFMRHGGGLNIECGWCVGVESRGKGIGSKIVERSIQEFVRGASIGGAPYIVLGASVDADNEASIKIANKYIGDEDVRENADGDMIHTYQRMFDFSK